jgi:hypothetical protein
MTGDDLKKMREAAGLNQVLMAKLLMVHPSSLSRWEASGEAVIKTDSLHYGLFMALQKLSPERLVELQHEAVAHGEVYSAYLALKEFYK